MTESPYFPFSAIVGQTDMKDALVCNAVNPEIGGVLIAGTRGTAKSTAARSLAHLLPRIKAVADCPYNCPPDDPDRQCERCTGRNLADRPDLIESISTPFVNLPLGATEDRVLGTIDLEAAIQEGERTFEPGLLAQANRGILYVDEVNLLGDHLVDVLLDAVATGTNRVEREGISFEHPANVMLVGTMNPEEGELRPQLLDRFGLYVEMDREMASEDRKAVVQRRTKYDADPEGMMEEWRNEEVALADRIETARDTVHEIRIDDDLLDRIANICIEHDVDGLRADIIIHRTARALAALDGAETVNDGHVTRAAELALGHRSNSGGSADPHGGDPDDDQPEREASRNPPDRPAPEALPDVDRPFQEHDRELGGPEENPDVDDENDEAPGESIEDHVFPITTGRKPPRPDPYQRVEVPDPVGRGGWNRVRTNDRRGVYYRARRPRGRPRDIAFDATVRAAAPHQVARSASGTSGLAIQLRPTDLRVKQRQSPTRNLVVFVVDSSGSMGAYERMSVVKGAILSLLGDAYQQRDYVSLVGFRKDRAETLLPPTASVRRAAEALAAMPTGGRTPLAAGLDRGLQLVERERRKQSYLVPLLVVVTDGRSNYTRSSSPPLQAALQQAGRIRTADVTAVCFDTESGPVRLGFVRQLADQMGAKYYRFDNFQADDISATVKDLFNLRRPPGS